MKLQSLVLANSADMAPGIPGPLPGVAAVPEHAAPVAGIPSQPEKILPRITIISSERAITGNDRIPEKLNLAEFGVTRFIYKSEVEPHLQQILQPAQLLHQMLRTTSPIRELKSVKAASGFETLLQDSSSSALPASRPPLNTGPEAVQSVRLVFEPPPPPPVVRSVSMDIGDPESQVRVVIRERNGNLNVQIASSNERLREDLQTAGPQLMRELQRNSPASVTLDFSNFGSATDSDSHPRSPSRAKKLLKSDAEFADVAETAYLPTPASALKSL